MKINLVTGYVRIPGHPRSQEEYDRLGAQLVAVSTPIRAFRCELKDCWLDMFTRDRAIQHATADNPKKNTLAYHVVQHQKTAWLLAALEVDPSVDVFVWIDYGIFHQPGITTHIIDDFLRRVGSSSEIAIAIPGAWEKAKRSAEWPNWRFCGSSLVISRRYVRDFHEAVRETALARLEAEAYVTWEVNDWAEVEQRNVLPIRWYRADHNQTQFTNY